MVIRKEVILVLALQWVSAFPFSALNGLFEIPKLVNNPLNMIISLQWSCPRLPLHSPLLAARQCGRPFLLLLVDRYHIGGLQNRHLRVLSAEERCTWRP